MSGATPGYGYGGGFALIVVLFILLIIVGSAYVVYQFAADFNYYIKEEFLCTDMVMVIVVTDMVEDMDMVEDSR